jgi:hypothetical protein
MQLYYIEYDTKLLRNTKYTCQKSFLFNIDSSN